jgi:hypothetical protein
MKEVLSIRPFTSARLLYFHFKKTSARLIWLANRGPSMTKPAGSGLVTFWHEIILILIMRFVDSAIE